MSSCRLCLGKQEIVDILKKSNSKFILTIIYLSTGVKIEKDDKFSQVCQSCLDVNVAMYRFRLKAYINNLKLKNEAIPKSVGEEDIAFSESEINTFIKRNESILTSLQKDFHTGLTSTAKPNENSETLSTANTPVSVPKIKSVLQDCITSHVPQNVDNLPCKIPQIKLNSFLTDVDESSKVKRMRKKVDSRHNEDKTLDEPTEKKSLRSRQKQIIYKYSSSENEDFEPSSSSASFGGSDSDHSDYRPKIKRFKVARHLQRYDNVKKLKSSQHTQKELEESNLKCVNCDRTFKTLQNLNKHKSKACKLSKTNFSDTISEPSYSKESDNFSNNSNETKTSVNSSHNLIEDNYIVEINSDSDVVDEPAKQSESEEEANEDALVMKSLIKKYREMKLGKSNKISMCTQTFVPSIMNFSQTVFTNNTSILDLVLPLLERDVKLIYKTNDQLKLNFLTSNISNNIFSTKNTDTVVLKWKNKNPIKFDNFNCNTTNDYKSKHLKSFEKLKTQSPISLDKPQSEQKNYKRSPRKRI